MQVRPQNKRPGILKGLPSVLFPPCTSFPNKPRNYLKKSHPRKTAKIAKSTMTAHNKSTDKIHQAYSTYWSAFSWHVDGRQDIHRKPQLSCSPVQDWIKKLGRALKGSLIQASWKGCSYKHGPLWQQHQVLWEFPSEEAASRQTGL